MSFTNKRWDSCDIRYILKAVRIAGALVIQAGSGHKKFELTG